MQSHAFARQARARRTIGIIYLDSNATTQPSPGVIEAMLDGLREHWHNPSSVHRAGQAARQQIELARRDVAELIGAKPRDVVFTSGGTESAHLAIRGVLAARSAGRAGDEAGASVPPILVTTRIEHAAIRDLAEDLEKSGAARVRWVGSGPDGRIDVEALERAVTPEVALVSMQWANNETGVVQPVEELAALCRARGVLFHCDGTQWVGKMPTDVGVGGIDLLTFAPHKFHGPKGVGVLWVRSGGGVRLRPVSPGSQELGRRGGTEAVPNIVGAGVAAREARAWLADEHERVRLAGLRDRFERHVVEAVPDAVVNGAMGGDASRRLWNTINIGFPRLEAEALLLLLSERGVCASAGAACSSGSLDPSPVLLAMGVPAEVAHGSVRFSLSKHTTDAELEDAARIVAECVARLRQSMPH